MNTPELLSPAGTLNNMRYAFAYGADAVYAGMPRYSLRVRNNDFLRDNLRIGISEAHGLGRKLYLAANLIPHGAKLKTFMDDIGPIVAMGPDALIMADPGLIMLVRERWPEMPIHLSVQANTTNAAAVRFWRSVGVERVILSRELSLDEVAEIRQACPDTEIEVFVHGALCIAYSGRCLLSGYFNHRDANQGSCTNACRWEYGVNQPAGEVGAGETKAGTVQASEVVVPMPTSIAPRPTTVANVGGSARHPAADGLYYLEEKQRPGEYMPIFEDEHGTYIMNSRDLRAVEHVQRLVAMGIDCLKIEGRTKSHYYAARTARVYRQAIDDAVAGRPFDPMQMTELESLANRGYTDAFYQRHPSRELQRYRDGSSRSLRSQFVAEVVATDPVTGLSELLVKNKFAVGDELELITPGGRTQFRLDAMQDLDGQALDIALGGGWRVRVRLPRGDTGLGLLARITPAPVASGVEVDVPSA